MRAGVQGWVGDLQKRKNDQTLHGETYRLGAGRLRDDEGATWVRSGSNAFQINE